MDAPRAHTLIWKSFCARDITHTHTHSHLGHGWNIRVYSTLPTHDACQPLAIVNMVRGEHYSRNTYYILETGGLKI